MNKKVENKNKSKRGLRTVIDNNNGIKTKTNKNKKRKKHRRRVTQKENKHNKKQCYKIRKYY